MERSPQHRHAGREERDKTIFWMTRRIIYKASFGSQRPKHHQSHFSVLCLLLDDSTPPPHPHNWKGTEIPSHTNHLRASVLAPQTFVQNAVGLLSKRNLRPFFFPAPLCLMLQFIISVGDFGGIYFLPVRGLNSDTASAPVSSHCAEAVLLADKSSWQLPGRTWTQSLCSCHSPA